MSQSRKILRIFFKIWVFIVSHGSVWWLVRGWRFQSRGYSEIFAAYLVTLLRVEFPVAKNTQKNFQNFVSKVFGGLPWRLVHDLIQSRKTRVLCFKDSFILKLFSCPSNILTVHCPLSQTHCVSHLNHHFHHLLNFNLQKKVWVFWISLRLSWL